MQFGATVINTVALAWLPPFSAMGSKAVTVKVAGTVRSSKEVTLSLVSSWEGQSASAASDGTGFARGVLVVKETPARACWRIARRCASLICQEFRIFMRRSFSSGMGTGNAIATPRSHMSQTPRGGRITVAPSSVTNGVARLRGGQPGEESINSALVTKIVLAIPEPFDYAIGISSTPPPHEVKIMKTPSLRPTKIFPGFLR